MNINIGLIWIGGVGLPAIAMAWAKVNNDTWVGLAVLGFFCCIATLIAKD